MKQISVREEVPVLTVAKLFAAVEIWGTWWRRDCDDVIEEIFEELNAAWRGMERKKL